MRKAISNDPEVCEQDAGLFHLTEHGWVRKDTTPFPKDRLETWQYDMERPHPDTKERVHLTRIWFDSKSAPSDLDALRARHGDAIVPSADRHITIDCHQ